MDTLEQIIKRASCPCRDEECQRELAHVRRAIRETLELAIEQVHGSTFLGGAIMNLRDLVNRLAKEKSWAS